MSFENKIHFALLEFHKLDYKKIMDEADYVTEFYPSFIEAFIETLYTNKNYVDIVFNFMYNKEFVNNIVSEILEVPKMYLICSPRYDETMRIILHSELLKVLSSIYEILLVTDNEITVNQFIVMWKVLCFDGGLAKIAIKSKIIKEDKLLDKYKKIFSQLNNNIDNARIGFFDFTAEDIDESDGDRRSD